MKKLCCIFISLILMLNFVLADNVSNEPIKLDLESVNIIESSDKTTEDGKLIEPSAIKIDIKEIKLSSKEDISKRVGADYFRKHFDFKRIKELPRAICIEYDYEYSNEITPMVLCKDPRTDKIISEMSSILEEPQEILFSKSDALNKVDELSLPEERIIKLIYYKPKETLAWKILWDYEPTLKERVEEKISGYTISAKNGEILDTHKFVLEPTGKTYKSPLEKTNTFQKLIGFFVTIWSKLWN